MNLLKKILAIVIIGLFIGSCFVPGIAKDTTKTTCEKNNKTNTDIDPIFDSCIEKTSVTYNNTFRSGYATYEGTKSTTPNEYDLRGWSNTEVVSMESSGNSYCWRSFLMADNDGTLHVVWFDSTNISDCGSDYDIFYKYKPSGGSWSTTEVVSTESTGNSRYPSMWIDNDGTVHVAWHDFSNYNGCYTDGDIFYKYKPSGGSWSTTEVVSTESTARSCLPSLMVEDDGTVHMAWVDHSDYDGCGTDVDIFYKSKPYNGTWSTLEVVSTESTSDSSHPSLTVGADGTVHVAWYDKTDYNNSGNDEDIFYKYKPLGGSWSITEIVSLESTSDSNLPSLVVDDIGTVHIAWEDYYQDYSGVYGAQIYYKCKPQNGSWSSSEVVSSESTGNSFSPSLIIENSGILHAAWYDLTNISGCGTDWDIFYKYKPSGGNWSTTEVVSTESINHSKYPSICTDYGGRIHVAWHDSTNISGCGSDEDIFYKGKSNGGDQRPVADFTWIPQNPVEDETITFDASSSYDPDGGSIVLYEWDWDNDGTYDESHTDPTATHSWSNSGDYQVTLRVTDDESEMDSETRTVHVEGGNIIYVPDDYPTIQGAIDNANSGDTVFVRSGTYHEYVNIDKTIHLIGEDRDTTIIDGDGSSWTIYIDHYVDNVEIAKFTIIDALNAAVKPGSYTQGTIIRNNKISGYGSSDGISCWNVGNTITIKDNIISNNYQGICISADSASIYHNDFINNDKHARDVEFRYWDNGNSGNYWDDYTGSDADGDGVGDTPYDVPGEGNSKDRYPLMEPWNDDGGGNQPPNPPTNTIPADGATDVDLSPTLSVDVFDPDGNPMDVTFYDVTDGSVIGTDCGIPSGGTATTTWPGLYTGATYFWCTIADDGMESTQSPVWSFTTKPNQPPNPPTNLIQTLSDGTEIPVGETIFEDTVVFKAVVTDPNGDSVMLQVELRRLDELGGGFDETVGGLKESTLVISGNEAVCTASGLIQSNYHWRARTKDENGESSEWIDFGSNDIFETDFSVQTSIEDKWVEIAQAPKDISGGASVIFYDNSLYITRGGGESDFWRYDITSRAWITLASLPEDIDHGADMAFDGERYTYATKGTTWFGVVGSQNFWRYDLQNNKWEILPDTPEEVGAKGALCYANGFVYLRPGGDNTWSFYRYSPVTQTWEEKASGPGIILAGGPECEMTYDGVRYIYTFQGGNNIDGTQFDEIWQYDTQNDIWMELGYVTREELNRADLVYVNGGLYALSKICIFNFDYFDLTNEEWKRKTDLPCGIGYWTCVGDGASLAFDGRQHIYALEGNNQKSIWRYGKIYYPNLGYAIIVAGKAEIGLRNLIIHSTNYAYKVLRNLGFDDNHIFYLNSMGSQDIDGDGDDEVDAPANYTNFNNIINQVKGLISNTGNPLIIFLTGHGDNNPFSYVLDKYDITPEGELRASDLQAMLSGFPSETRMLIFVNSCYSGGFISAQDGISGDNRIIITGAHDNQLLTQKIGWNRVLCSNRFWWNLNCGYNVKDAFTAKAFPGDWWWMWLDDNGDRIGSPPNNLGQDGNLAADTKIGLPGTESLELMSLWKIIQLNSPGELRVYDSQNRITGLFYGEIKEEIPNSLYDDQNETVVIYSSSNNYCYEVVGTDNGIYGLDITSFENGAITAFTATDIPTSPNATHQYTIDWTAISQGEEGVTLRIDADGDGIFEQNITCGNSFKCPYASFIYNPNNPVVNETIMFDASGSIDINGTIVNWLWDFGDGTNASDKIVNHSYSKSGVYLINLTITNNQNQTSSASTFLRVNQPPTANFTLQLVDPTTQDIVYFNDTSSDSDGFIVNWSWDFGDGNSSYDQNATHQYIDDGSYIVNLTVRDNDDATDSVEKVITVSNVPPVADFIYEPANPTTQDIILFIDASTDSDGIIVNWTWYFGDDNITYNQDPTHQYIDDGIYFITLNITDDDGATNETSKQINVSNVEPIAYFSHLPKRPVVNQTITFNAFESYDPDGIITNYSWDFGDGTIGSGMIVTHNYSASGKYTVTLIVTDNDGFTSSYFLEVRIKSESIPGFELLFFIAAIVIASLWKRRRNN